MIIDEIVIEEKESDLNEIILEENKFIPHVEQIEVVSTNKDYTVEPTKGYFNKIIIKGDENLKPDNIIKHCTIFGVSGIAEADSKTIKNMIAGEEILELPEGITEIRKYAFYHFGANMKITKIPDSVISIGDGAFYNCPNLAITTVPAGVTEIRQNTFYKCTSLTELTFEGPITTINLPFQSCSNLKKIVMPNLTKVPSVTNTRTFDNICFDNSGFIYVPDVLIETIKNDSRWKTWADYIKPISELESE